ncbi:MAG: LysR family transcriptional regulator [Methyloligellaceae bacterium]
MKLLLTYKYVDEVVKAGSIRKASETLSITPSALNRRILSLEEDLGVAIFERLPHGVRLSAAGELLIHHIRNQLSDMERVRSQIADLSGIRRGHVSIASSQALLPYFIPNQMAIYRQEYPGVSFGVHGRDREAAEQALYDYSADIALVFEPVRLTDFHTLLTVPQPIHAILAQDHPLAHKKILRLRDLVEYPLALPAKPYGVRALLETAAIKHQINLDPVIVSDSFDFLRHISANQNVISFQIQIGLPQKEVYSGMVDRQIDLDDVPPGFVHLAQLKGRTLAVAAARFADQLVSAFIAEYNCN